MPTAYANMAIILNEAEKVFRKVIKDSINKVITDCTFAHIAYYNVKKIWIYLTRQNIN
jgi:hypothetical protein